MSGPAADGLVSQVRRLQAASLTTLLSVGVVLSVGFGVAAAAGLHRSARQAGLPEPPYA